MVYSIKVHGKKGGKIRTGHAISIGSTAMTFGTKREASYAQRALLKNRAVKKALNKAMLKRRITNAKLIVSRGN